MLLHTSSYLTICSRHVHEDLCRLPFRTSIGYCSNPAKGPEPRSLAHVTLESFWATGALALSVDRINRKGVLVRMAPTLSNRNVELTRDGTTAAKHCGMHKA